MPDLTPRRPGRPRNPNPTERLNVFIPTDLKARLTDASIAERVPEVVIVRRALERELAS